MNDSSKLTNNRSYGEQPRSPNERRAGEPLILAAADFNSRDPRRMFSNHLTVWVIVLFWTAQHFALTADQVAFSPGYFRMYFWPRLMTSALGVILSLAIAAGQSRLRDRKLGLRAVAALSFGVVAAAIAGAMTFLIERPFEKAMPPFWPQIVGEIYVRIWLYVAISVIVLAVSYASDIQRREQRIAALQALADSAQVRALRDQLNPHFLFNALNSIIGLIASDHKADAERMTENVADFLRVSIAMDAQMLISLCDELRLQDLYLEIQKMRFPDRLSVESDVPDDIQNALVPALITQPLIENSIKYAVARSTEPVRLSIRARRLDSSIEIIIEDDGGNAGGVVPKGAKLGLSNVTDRLFAHYGSSASFHASAKDSGGFRNVIVIPGHGAGML